MATAKKPVDATVYVCKAVCRYKDTTYSVGDELEMGEREAEFLVNSGKFAKKLNEKEVKAEAQAQAEADAKVKAEAQAQAQAEADAKAKTQAELDKTNTAGSK